LRKVEAVTADEMLAVANEVFPAEGLSCLIFAPEEG
jgi:hypothetical protein